MLLLFACLTESIQFGTILTETQSHGYTFTEKHGIYLPSLWSPTAYWLMKSKKSEINITDVLDGITSISYFGDYEGTITYTSSKNTHYSAVFATIPKKCSNNLYVSNTYDNISLLSTSNQDKSHIQKSSSFCILLCIPSVTSISVHLAQADKEDEVEFYYGPDSHITLQKNEQRSVDSSGILVIYKASSKETDRQIIVTPNKDSILSTRTIQGWKKLTSLWNSIEISFIILMVILSVVFIVVLVVIILCICGYGVPCKKKTKNSLSQLLQDDTQI